MIALTVRRPWPWAIAHGGMRVISRTWRLSWPRELAIHAGRGAEPYYALERVAELSGRPVAEVVAGSVERHRGVVIAVADLIDVCTVRGGYDDCDCGPWAVPGQCHWVLENVQVLARPVRAVGQQRLWYLSESAEADVRAQLVRGGV